MLEMNAAFVFVTTTSRLSGGQDLGLIKIDNYEFDVYSLRC